ncbi:DNA mismatch repair protein [Ophiocordyceps camponoti-floridani]|uniref:DNA mismatch repair protein n=1 Tax=Ophiocordyceps camponoti-floridani TaxID=2030778 RepID=A0A8H4Q8P5_9HYPO|nr:DNA mismatch repair protein [Ophiocordyceps camponoti-floridani]
MSISRLPDHVVDKLRASAAIKSLNGVVCGLIKNSLDGGAARALIRLDYARGNCSVEDDGQGIEPSEFREDGGLGKLHHTSKTSPSFRIHGSRGDFLASLAGLSLLSITSHHHRHLSQAFIAIHDSMVLTRQVPASAEQRLSMFDHGTRVSVHALFGSMPVRAKHQASLFSGRSAVDREWSQLVQEILALLLAWPSEASVTLTETAVHRQLRLRSSPDANLATRSSRLFAQASFADSDDSESWIPLSASGRHMMSLGVQPVLDKHESNFLYEAINQVFRNSSFGVVESRETDATTGKPRKGLERWPMFYLHITLPGAEMSDLDMTNESHKVVGDIVHLLKSLSFEFLRKHGMRPRAIDSTKSTWRAAVAQPSRAASKIPHATAEAVPSRRPLDDWQRVKVGRVARRPKGTSIGRHPLRHQGTDARRLVGEDGRLLGMPFDDAQPLGTPPAGQTDAARELNATTTAGGTLTVARQAGRPRVLGSGSAKRQPSEWLQGVLETWANPVFETAEAVIPSVQAEASGQVVRFETKSMKLEARVSRSALAEAEVIGQVDRKFVLARLSLKQGSPATGLVVIDQHAADERCRLEDLCQTYFDDVEVATEALRRPVLFEASGREVELLRRYRHHFHGWGVIYAVEADCQVRVTSLPPSIAERCSSEPRLLIDLIRREMWALADGAVTPSTKSETGGPSSWPRRLRGCPSGILELLYSRSCRSAIMFNDELSAEEQRQLVKKLAHCAFPFQCAHGRPSMVPLADLGCGVGRSWRETEMLGGRDWERWMDGDDVDVS